MKKPNSPSPFFAIFRHWPPPRLTPVGLSYDYLITPPSLRPTNLLTATSNDTRRQKRTGICIFQIVAFLQLTKSSRISFSISNDSFVL